MSVSCSGCKRQTAREMVSENPKCGHMVCYECELLSPSGQGASCVACLSCPICLSKLEEPTKLCMPETDEKSERKCTHVFCWACIEEWSKINTACPLCNEQFASMQSAKRGKAVEKRDVRKLMNENDLSLSTIAILMRDAEEAGMDNLDRFFDDNFEDYLDFTPREPDRYDTTDGFVVSDSEEIEYEDDDDDGSQSSSEYSGECCDQLELGTGRSSRRRIIPWINESGPAARTRAKRVITPSPEIGYEDYEEEEDEEEEDVKPVTRSVSLGDAIVSRLRSSTRKRSASRR
jgi:hypothetical protein